MSTNFNLPPGVSMNDIDLPITECPSCGGTGIDDSNPSAFCRTCGGDGTVLASSIHPTDKNPQGIGEDDLSYD